MHTLLAVALAPVIAAEKSKTPFYIAGGALVVWALLVSLALGLRNADFPGNLGGQRIVSAITAVLVIAAASTAVISSGGEAKKAEAAAPGPGTPGEQAPPGAPARAGGAAETGAAPPPAAGVTAATGTATTKAAPAPAPASTALSLEANPGGQLLYNSKQLKAKAGTVVINFSNPSPVEHNVTVLRGSATVGATPTFTGGSKSLTLTLKPGTYTFYCSVPGHRQAGMEGTLTVS